MYRYRVPLNVKFPAGWVCLAFLIGVFSLFTTQSFAQSFSCAKAEIPAEFAICNSENLIVLDEQMAKLHRAQSISFSTKPQVQQFSRNGLTSLKKRNACKQDFTCLELRYRERIRALSGRQL